MSHGGGGGGSGEQSSEPNLTPLLDMVLQLVMFFMLVANFVMDEMSDKIKLPSANQAKPLTANDRTITYLNVDRTGRVLVPAREPLLTDKEILFHMNEFARNHPLGAGSKDVVTVIIRADKDSKFEQIYKVMAAIKSAGFKKLQLRAEIGS
jgi:biopolymer transport protein ExbD